MRQHLRILIFGWVLAYLAVPAVAMTELGLFVDVDGTAYLYNSTASPLPFDGYQIVSETKDLNPMEWTSIADRVAGGQITEVIAALGPGGLTFGEANPSEGNLAELNLGGAATLQPGWGGKFAIGRPFIGPGWWGNNQFFYHAPGATAAIPGDIFVVPEPSTWLLLLVGSIAALTLVNYGATRTPGS